MKLPIDYLNVNTPGINPYYKNRCQNISKYNKDWASEKDFRDNLYFFDVFESLDLSAALFDRCEFEKSTFYNCNLQNSSFLDMLSVYKLVFVNCDLRMAQFDLTDLEGFGFSACDLRDTNLVEISEKTNSSHCRWK